MRLLSVIIPARDEEGCIASTVELELRGAVVHKFFMLVHSVPPPGLVATATPSGVFSTAL